MHGYRPPSSWANNPTTLPKYTVEYYRSTWGFDPANDLMEIAEEEAGYYNEVRLPLENDPYLKDAGIQLVARVEVDVDGESHNRLGFARGETLAFVECVHTAIYDATPAELATFSPGDNERLLSTTEGRPAILPPWEHFASLKSFAAGLFDQGIAAILFASPDGPLSESLYERLITVLYDIAPKIIESQYIQHLGDVIERAPKKWIKDSAEILVDHYKFEILFQNKAYLASVDNSNLEKILILFLELICKDLFTNLSLSARVFFEQLGGVHFLEIERSQAIQDLVKVILQKLGQRGVNLKRRFPWGKL